MNTSKQAYLKLFNAITDAVALLQQAQADGEALFLQGDAPAVRVFPPVEGEQKPPDT